MDTFTVSKYARAPIVERVAGWSVRHRIVAVTGWLLLVIVAFAVGQPARHENPTSYDPGQAGQAERVLNRPGVSSRPRRACLSRRAPPADRSAPTPDCGGPRRGGGRAARRAAGRRRHAVAVHAGGRPDFQTAGRPWSRSTSRGTRTTTTRPWSARNARSPPYRPGIPASIAEAGDASVDRATNDIVSADFRHAELTSVPVSLVLLLSCSARWSPPASRCCWPARRW